MNRSWVIFIAGLASGLGMTSNAMHPAAQSNNAFGFDMLGRLSAQKGNIAFSPVSVWSALTLIAAGAEGETRGELDKVLALADLTPRRRDQEKEFGLSYGDATSFASEWLERLKTSASTRMIVTSRLWGAADVSFRPDFLSLAQKSFGVIPATLDFHGDLESARRKLQEQTPGETNGMSSALAGALTIREDARLVLTSTFAFDGKWAAPFDARDTMKKEFTQDDGRKTQVDMMTGVIAAGYLEDERLQALRLPFAGGDMSMIVVLPKKAGALADGPFLSAPDFMLLRAMMRDEPRVSVRLPKFHISASMEFSPHLMAAGVKRLFGKDAQLNGVCAEPAMISSLLHQAAIRVTEAGAASTAILKAVTAPEPGARASKEGKSFIASSPFLFFVLDENFSGVVLAGVVRNPAW